MNLVVYKHWWFFENLIQSLSVITAVIIMLFQDIFIIKKKFILSVFVIVSVLSFKNTFASIISKNSLQNIENFYHNDVEKLNNSIKDERIIFDYTKNGMRVDIRVVPIVNDSAEEIERFPQFPSRDLGRCVMQFSFACMKDRMARYIDTVGKFNKNIKLGENFKLVKTRPLVKRHYDERSLQSTTNLDQSIDSFFDSFVLRINLPRERGKQEERQINFMYDDRDVVEGKKKKLYSTFFRFQK